MNPRTGALQEPAAAWCVATDCGVRLALQVAPNAKKSKVCGPLDDVLKVRLQARPIDGKANAALIRFLAQTLEVPLSKVNITHGLTSKRKLVEVTAPQLRPDAVIRSLLALVQ